MDLNGFPAKPTLLPVAVPAPATGEVVASPERPKIFNQMCIACHSLEGQGGVVGPALAGFVVQYLGFAAAFYLFSAIAALAALVFVLLLICDADEFG